MDCNRSSGKVASGHMATHDLCIQFTNAAYQNDMNALKQLCLQHPSFDLNKPRDLFHNYSLAMVCASQGYLEMLEWLIDRKASVCGVDNDSQSVLHIAARRLPGRHADAKQSKEKADALERTQVAICELLIKGKADVNAEDALDWTPRDQAKHSGNLLVEQCLAQHGGRANKF